MYLLLDQRSLVEAWSLSLSYQINKNINQFWKVNQFPQLSINFWFDQKKVILLFALKGLLKSLNYFEYITLFDAEFKKVLYLKCWNRICYQQRRSYIYIFRPGASIVTININWNNIWLEIVIYCLQKQQADLSELRNEKR